MIELLSVALSGFSAPAILAALAVIAQLWLAGRLVVGRDAPDLVAFGAGWGLVAVAMTVLGTTGGGSLAPLPLALWAVAGLSLLREIRRRTIPTGLMALVVTLPLALLASGRVGSEWDEFSHWLHAFRYLDAFEMLPGKGRPAMESCCAAYPYGWPLLGYLSARLIGFSEAVPGLLSLFMLALCGDLVARILAKGERPGWAHQGWGGLLVTVLGTTFVPKLVFTAYADVATSTMVLAGLWLAWRLAAKPDWSLAAALGLCLAALVTQKPANLVLAVLILGCGFMLCLRGWSWPRRDAVLGLALAALPVVVAVVLWRGYVAANLAGEEPAVRPFAQWHWNSVGTILLAMLDVARNKGGYFGVMLAALVWSLASLRRPTGDATRLVRAVTLAFIGYNAFLFFTYFAIFQQGDGERVMSYWRYNTHLGLLTALVLAIGLVALADRWPVLARWSARAWFPLALAAIGPFVAVKHVRFDADPGKRLLRDSLRQVKAMGVDDVAVVDPRGSGLSHVMASYEWDGKPRLPAYTTGFDDFTAEQYRAKMIGARHVLIVSWNEAVAAAFPGGTPGAHSQLLNLADGRVLATFPYPGNREPKAYP